MTFVDLSFALAQPRQITVLPIELAVLMVGVASRQAASPTARTQAALGFLASGDDAPLHPESGAFSAVTAAALRMWQEE